MVTYALVCLLALLPLTPGGLGIVEGVGVPVLVSFGTPHGVALVGVLAWRLFEFWLPIPLALVAYGWLRLTTFRSGGTPGRPARRRIAVTPPHYAGRHDGPRDGAGRPA